MNTCRFTLSAAAAIPLSIVLGADLIATSSAASAAGLFDPATSAEARAAGTLEGPSTRSAQRPPAVLRERVVRINRGALAGLVPVGADKDANRITRARALSGPITIEVFPGFTVRANRTSVDAPDEGGFVWSGEERGTRNVFVTLSIMGNEIFGTVQTDGGASQVGGKLYGIQPISRGLHRIVEYNQDRIETDIELKAPANLPRRERSLQLPREIEVEGRALTAIRVLVANTITARNQLPGSTIAAKQDQMNQRIALALKRTNDAFLRSGVDINFVRVGGMTEVNFNESSFYGGLNGPLNDNFILCDLSGVSCQGNNNLAKFANVRSKRDTVNADLVVLMRRKSNVGVCGIAWTPDPPTLTGFFPTDVQGYAVVSSTPTGGGFLGCIETDTFAHETGHTMGLNHDRIQFVSETGGTNPPKSKFNFGHVNKTKKFYTIMGYAQSCGSGCTRAPYFSTPLKNFNGAPLGIVGGATNAADATRTLNTNKAVIRLYE